jgi:hypothetical protein
VSNFNVSQIKADIWQLAHVNPFVQAYTVHQTVKDIRSGDTAGARENIKLGLTGAMIGAVGGTGAAYPGAAFRVLKTAHNASPSQSIPGYGTVDYVKDLKGERDRNDLEGQDFLFYALPEVVQIAIKRWTFYDMPPEMATKLVASHLVKLPKTIGRTPTTRSNPDVNKRKSTKTPIKSRTGRKFCRNHTAWDYCWRR